LRQHAFDILAASKANPLAGLIFVVDAAALSTADALSSAAEYLHDVLLVLQKRYTTAKTSKAGVDLPVLIAANKLDLFTALPALLVKRELEKEISKVRETRAKGLRLAGKSDESQEEESEWLGDDGEFRFGQMEQVNIKVDVQGGSVNGGDGSDIKLWWMWIADQL
jgi:signal recognition particle receptor subunit beta